MFGARLALAAAAEPGLFARASAWMEGFATSPHSTAWLFVFAFAESSFFPIPPDALLIALCVVPHVNESLAATMWFALVCTVASALGGAFGYLIGVKAGKPILRRVARPRTVETAERLLQRYDVWAVGAAGFTPIPYKIFTIASGMLGVKFVRFVIVSVASRGARFFLVAGLCYLTADEVKYYLKHHLGWATVALLALLVAGFWALKALGRRFTSPDDPAPVGGLGPATDRDSGPSQGTRLAEEEPGPG